VGPLGGATLVAVGGRTASPYVGEELSRGLGPRGLSEGTADVDAGVVIGAAVGIVVGCVAGAAVLSVTIACGLLNPIDSVG